jgi:hypothetical protein
MNAQPVPMNPFGHAVPDDKIEHRLSYYDDHKPKPGDGVVWRAETVVEKYNAPSADVRAGLVEPDEVIHSLGNILTYGGANILWLGIKGGLSASTGLNNTYFDNTNATIIVGSSGAAAAVGDTDLSASTDTDRAAVGMEATYPLHTTSGGTTAMLDITFRSVFDTNTANFAWEEWGILNTTLSTAPLASTNGTLLNRKAEALGTKTSAATWTFTCKLSLS